MAAPQNPTLNEHGQPVGISVSSDPAKAPSNTQPLEGRVVSLKALLPSHSTALYPLISGAENARLWTYIAETPCLTATDFHAQIEAKSHSTDPLFYSIWCASPNSTLSKNNQNAKPVGYLSLLNIDLGNRKVEIGHIMYSKFLQQSVASTEAVYLLMKYSFETLGMRRVEWKCNSLNAPSARAAKRLGFRYEGEFKNHMIVKGKNRDTTWFSVTEEEWKVVKGGLDVWLREENFKEGVQLSKLEDCRSRFQLDHRLRA